MSDSRVSSVLPVAGEVSVEQLSALIREAHEILGVPNSAEVRSVLFAVDGRLANAATIVRIGRDDPPERDIEEVLEVGPLVLTSVRTRASSLADAEAVRGFFTRWASATNSTVRFEPQFPTAVYRNPSFSDWDSGPSWMIDVHDNSGISARSGPRGPFYEPRSMFFAESLGAAAHQWLGDPYVREITNSANYYHVLIRDQRASVAHAELKRSGDAVDDAELLVRLTSGLPNLPSSDIAVVTSDFDGVKRRIVKRIDGESVRVPIELPVQTLEAVILDRSSGDWLDRVHQGGYGRVSLVAPPREAVEPKYQQLRDDLEKGECESVEFKPFIDLDRRNPKSFEILKEVTAFANANGGVMYVGVNDDAEVVGVSKEFFASRRNAAVGDFEELRKAYADSIRRIVNEGITPTPKTHIEWISHAGLYVLRVEIPYSEAAPHQIVENGQYWVRRGGTCKRGLPEEFVVRHRQKSTDGSASA